MRQDDKEQLVGIGFFVELRNNRAVELCQVDRISLKSDTFLCRPPGKNGNKIEESQEEEHELPERPEHDHGMLSREATESHKRYGCVDA